MFPWSMLPDSNSSLPSDFQSQSLHHQPLPEWSLQRALMLWNARAVHQGQVPALLSLLSVPACPVSSVSQHPKCPTDLFMYLGCIFNCILAFVLGMTVQVTTGHLFSKINNIYLDPKRKKKNHNLICSNQWRCFHLFLASIARFPFNKMEGYEETQVPSPLAYMQNKDKLQKLLQFNNGSASSINLFI